MKTTLLHKILLETNDKKQMDLFLKALFTNKELKELENIIKIFQLFLIVNIETYLNAVFLLSSLVTRGANTFETEKIFEEKLQILETLRLYKNKKNA